MKPYKNPTMGLEVIVQVPETNDEYDRLAGKANAACEDGVTYNIYHNWNGKFRPTFLEEVEKETGVTRKVDEAKTAAQPKKKDGTQTPVYEKESLYFKRVLAETGRTAQSFQELAQRLADAQPLELAETASAGRIGKEYKTASDDLFTTESSKPGTLARVVANLERLNPGLTVEMDAETNLPTPDGLAKAIKINADRKRREDLAELASE